MRAMILAAGRGERLRPLTEKLPKPLIEVHGKPLIEHHLEGLAGAGFRHVTVNLSHLGGMIRDTLGDGRRWGVTLHYSEEPPDALETGGGIQRALEFLGDGPFAVINGDVFCGYPLGRLRMVKCDQAHLVLVPNPDHNPAGDFSLQAGYVGLDGPPFYTFSGIAVYHPRFFAGADPGRYSVKPMLRAAANRRQVTGEVFRGEWHDVGTLERLRALRGR